MTSKISSKISLKKKIYNGIEWDGNKIEFCHYTFDGLQSLTLCKDCCPFYDKESSNCIQNLISYRDKLKKIQEIIKE